VAVSPARDEWAVSLIQTEPWHDSNCRRNQHGSSPLVENKPVQNYRSDRQKIGRRHTEPMDEVFNDDWASWLKNLGIDEFFFRNRRMFEAAIARKAIDSVFASS
jgi:hypothetical protein